MTKGFDRFCDAPGIREFFGRFHARTSGLTTMTLFWRLFDDQIQLRKRFYSFGKKIFMKIDVKFMMAQIISESEKF